MGANDRWNEPDVLEAAERPRYETVEAAPGLRLVHTASNTRGHVVGYSPGDRILLEDEFGVRHTFRDFDGAFTFEGRRVALAAPSGPARKRLSFTASGSVATPGQRAKVAAASRIWVEGLHDAELIEQVWGDDLRYCGIVVEPLHGADDLARAVTDFQPGPQRRLGVLLDHLVAGSKESRIAAETSQEFVLIRGHRYVDIWQAIKPSVAGLDQWPTVPVGEPWKQGVLERISSVQAAGEYWKQLLGRVGSYTDLETDLVNAVEQLIDFVADPEA